jgi:hypothetical protein
MLGDVELDARIEGDQVAFGFLPTGSQNGSSPEAV